MDSKNFRSTPRYRKMGVKVSYEGRFGNNIFQYATARAFAQENNMALHTPWRVPEVVAVHESAVAESSADQRAETGVGDHDGALEKRFEDGRYVLRGYFQKASPMWQRRATIRSWFRFSAVPQRPDDEIVAHVRLTDYRNHQIAIAPSWYDQVLSQLHFSKLTVVTDEPHSSYMTVFSKWHPQIVSRSLINDFDLIREFSSVVMSNSTFAWWAAFFGHATRCYTFKPWIRNPNVELSEFPGSICSDGVFI